MNYDDLKFSVEAMSGGKNTVILDDLGKPSVMVSVPKMKYSDIIDDGSDETLPCFIVDGQELDQIWVSKYINIVVDDRAYSLPNQDPRTSIDFDTAVQVCRNKGEGWALMPNGLWGAVQGWCLKNGFMPHGNSNYGADYTYPHEKGVCSYSDDGVRSYRTGTGSGPATWYHDGTTTGIADLSGNVYEFCSGMRLVDGEIQIIPEGNCMKLDCDLSANSTEWRAIMPDGTLVPTGTEGTLKYNMTSANVGLCIDTKVDYSGYGYTSNFTNIKAANGIDIPDLLQAVGLATISNRSYGNGSACFNTSGERFPCRSNCPQGRNATGMSSLNVIDLRTSIYWLLGFRSVYYQLPSA